MSDKDQNSTQIAADSEHNRSSSSNNIGLKRKTARSEEEARDVRLEQNRVAARESRKRKKKMVEDLATQQFVVANIAIAVKREAEALVNTMKFSRLQRVFGSQSAKAAAPAIVDVTADEVATSNEALLAAEGGKR